MSDIQETHTVVRLAKAHTDLALLVCKIPVDQICFASYRDASGGSTRAEVIMFADMALLAGLAGDLTVSPLQRSPWVCLRRSPKVTGYVHSGVKWYWA